MLQSPAGPAAGPADDVEPNEQLIAPEHALGSNLSRLRMAVLISSFSTVCLGYNTAIIAGAILYIKDDPDFEPLDSFMQGALVSSALAGAAIGAMCGTLADLVGRRRCLLIVACIFLLGPTGMALSPNIWFLIAARTFCGLGIGVSSVLVNLYISEIAPAEIRGQLGGWAPFLGTFGILVSYIVSAALGTLPNGAWRWQLFGAVVPAVAQLMFHRFIPETPRWLLSKGCQEEAISALRRLFPSASDDALQAEIEKINTDLLKVSEHRKLGLCGLCTHQLLPSFLGTSINVLQQVSGINVVIYFGPTILDDAGFSDTLSMIATAGVSVLQLLATVVLIRHVDRIGRRPLALLGILLMLVGLACLVLSFLCEGHQSKRGGMISWTAWVSIVGMFIFRGAFSLSLGPLPYIMTSEFFPQEARAAGTALSWTSNWGSNFLVSLSFPLVVDAFARAIGHEAGVAVIFGIYMVFCLVAFAFVFIMLPETRGVRLEAMEDSSSLRRLSYRN